MLSYCERNKSYLFKSEILSERKKNRSTVLFFPSITTVNDIIFKTNLFYASFFKGSVSYR